MQVPQIPPACKQAEQADQGTADWMQVHQDKRVCQGRLQEQTISHWAAAFAHISYWNGTKIGKGFCRFKVRNLVTQQSDLDRGEMVDKLIKCSRGGSAIHTSFKFNSESLPWSVTWLKHMKMPFIICKCGGMMSNVFWSTQVLERPFLCHSKCFFVFAHIFTPKTRRLHYGRFSFLLNLAARNQRLFQTQSSLMAGA